MKRYLLFAGDNAQGGWRDFAGDFDSIEEARAHHGDQLHTWPEVEARWLNVAEPMPADVAEVVPDVRMVIGMLELADGDQITLWQAHQRGIRVDEGEASHEILNLSGIPLDARSDLQAEIDRYAEAPSSDHVWFRGLPEQSLHVAIRPGPEASQLAWQHIVDGHDGMPQGQWDEEHGWVMVPGAHSGIIIAGAGDIPPRT